MRESGQNTQSEAGSESPHLDSEEQDQAAEHAALEAMVIHEIVRAEGESALERTTGELMWSGLAAGLSMGFSFLTEGVVLGALPDTSSAHLIASFGYSIGFIIVVLGRQQLFTESTLTAVLPVLVRRDMHTLMSALRLWVVVLLANLVGTAIFAALLCVPEVFRQETLDALGVLAEEAVSDTFFPTMLKAVLSGWLIALMVWLLPNAKSARLFTILIITYVVAVNRLSHVVAGSVEVAWAVMNDRVQLSEYFLRFLLPTLLGNIIGGVSLVALLNHAPLATRIHGEQNERG
jgi:formate/nitrite transporter FocA (FNT family)